MYLTGFADEAAKDIDGQIKATKALAWKYIEARSINDVNFHNLSDEDFDIVYGKLQDGGIGINCFGSTIANWGKRIDEPMDSSISEVKRAIPKMKKLGTKLIRIMSFAVLEDRDPYDQMEEERFRRMREIQKMFSNENLIPVHENCMNYGGMGWKFTLRLLENVPGMKLVFDTGNCIFSLDRAKLKPWPRQSAWEFYSHVKEHISYVHIKDGILDETSGKEVCTYPGEGMADVRRIVKDLLDNGYDGGFSIEPHMKVVYHDSSIKTDEDVMFDTYVEYGRRMMKIIDEIKGV